MSVIYTHTENPEHSLDNQSGRNCSDGSGGSGGCGGLWVWSPRCLVCSSNHGYRQSCPRLTFFSGYQNNHHINL